MPAGGGIGGGIETGAITAPPVPSAPAIPTGVSTPGIASEMGAAAKAVSAEAPAAPTIPGGQSAEQAVSENQDVAKHITDNLPAEGANVLPGAQAEVVANAPAFEQPIAGSAPPVAEGAVPPPTVEPAAEPVAEQPQEQATPLGARDIDPRNANPEARLTTRQALANAVIELGNLERDLAQPVTEAERARLFHRRDEAAIRVQYLQHQDQWERAHIVEKPNAPRVEGSASAEGEAKKTTAQLLGEARKTREGILAEYTKKDAEGHQIGLTDSERTSLDARLLQADLAINSLDAQLTREQLAESWSQKDQSAGEPPASLDMRDRLQQEAGLSPEDARHLNVQFLYNFLDSLWQGLNARDASDKAFSDLFAAARQAEVAQGEQQERENIIRAIIKRILTVVLQGILQAVVEATGLKEQLRQQQAGVAPTAEPGGVAKAEQGVTPPRAPATTEAPVATAKAPVAPVVPVA